MRIEYPSIPAAAQPPGNRLGDRLEAAFLAEMLSIALPDGGATPFGGGPGESQFRSFLNEQYGQALAQRMDLRLDLRLTDRNGAGDAR